MTMGLVRENKGIHPYKMVKYICLGMLLCVLIGAAGFLSGRYTAANRETAPELSAVVVESRLTEIRELATMTYSYTNMAQFESSNDFYGVKVPFTTKKFILTYDGIIKAGVDLSRAQVEVSGGEVRIVLPEAQILSHEIEEDSVESFDEKTSIFNPFTVEDFTAFQTEQKAVMEEKAVSRGLLAQAGQKARESVLLMMEEVLPEDTVLTVEISE